MSELRRKNSVGVVEKAHLRTDKEAYDEGYDRIFGKRNHAVEKEDNLTGLEERVAEEIKRKFNDLNFREGLGPEDYYKAGFLEGLCTDVDKFSEEDHE